MEHSKVSYPQWQLPLQLGSVVKHERDCGGGEGEGGRRGCGNGIGEYGRGGREGREEMKGEQKWKGRVGIGHENESVNERDGGGSREEWEGRDKLREEQRRYGTSV